MSEPPKPAPPSAEDLAAAFPQLEILELIGQGGMGFVFKARQPKLDRFVALKILPQSLATDPAFAERFTREGRVLARLNHPNIVTIHDFGQANGFFYLLMEFVDGVNLRQAMRVGRFTPAQALAIVPKICEALQFAHDEGILHRDIKPENILLDSKGRVKIADFGVAKLLGAEARPATTSISHGAEPGPQALNLTETGKALGTPNYMAPEQLEHPHDVDQRADIYSLGVVFYEMLTGELPLGRFAPPSEKSAVDPRVDEVVLRTLEKERERRTRTANEVRTEVETITAARPKGPAGSQAISRPQDREAAGRFEPVRRPRSLIVVSVLFIIGGSIAVWEAGHDLTRHAYDLNLSLLALPIGIGLLRLRPWWRIAALADLCAFFALLTTAVGLTLTGHFTPGALSFFGHHVTGQTPVWFASVFYAAVLGYLLWMYRVLTRPDVRALFSPRPRARPWIEWGLLAAGLLAAWGASWLLLLTGLDRINRTLTPASFGPAVDRVLYVEQPEKAFLDLATGDYVSPPKNIDPADWRSEQLTTWLGVAQRAGAMATTLDSTDTHLGLCFAASRPVPNRTWDKPWLIDTPALESLTNSSPQVSPVAVLTSQSVPSTVVFHTRDNTAGLLQIVGLKKNPRSVSIRYRLLQGQAVDRAKRGSPPEGPGQAGLVSHGESVPALAEAPAPEGKLVIAPEHFTMAHAEPGEMDWGFKCFVPPDRLASLLFVVRSNGVPIVDPGFSTYFKVGKSGGIDLTPCLVSCYRIAELQSPTLTGARRAQMLAAWNYPESAGLTNAIRWDVSLGAGFTASRWLAMPPYHRVEFKLAQSLRSGHQLRIPLIDFDRPEGSANPGPSGVELRILLEPLRLPAVRMLPGEVYRTNYIAGSGLARTMQETLNSIETTPIEP